MTSCAMFDAIAPDGTKLVVSRVIAEEVPIAIEVDGIGYAVLMGTGEALEDLAYGFALGERLIERADQVLDVDTGVVEAGIMLRLALSQDRQDRVRSRVRHRSTDSACGLCGIENLEQAMRSLPRLPATAPVAPAAVFAALEALDGHQSLNQRTGAAHAAALCAGDGAIRLVREDVGRHNAFDKLIGAMLRGGLGWDGGFALLSSRCSYDLVEKAVLAGCPTLATISAPTSLALTRAGEAGLSLVVLARPDRILSVPEDGARADRHSEDDEPKMVAIRDPERSVRKVREHRKRRKPPLAGRQG